MVEFFCFFGGEGVFCFFGGGVFVLGFCFVLFCFGGGNCFLGFFFFFFVVEVSFNPKSHFSKGSEYLTAVLLVGLVSPTSTFSVACCRARGTSCQIATGLLGT